jgi:hypothetical protein
MRNAAIVIGIVIVGMLVVAGYFMFKGPDLSKYTPLQQPALITMPDQKMLVVEARGPAGVIAGKSIGLLYKAIFKIKGAKMAPPRARWPLPLETSPDQWIGIFGLPVPDSTAKVPEVKVDSGYNLRVETWAYGQVAQILHVGPYDKESPTVERLKKFIAESGYEIAGPHEEEYVKGPMWFMMGDPEKYYTIIRYQVRPVSPDTIQLTGK